MQIERTGRKRRQKRLIIALTALCTIGLGGGIIYFLSQTEIGPASVAAEAIPLGPVTEDEADEAMAEAEALQTLVSDLGTAVVEAGITDMAPLEKMLTLAVDVSSAAGEMWDAVDLGAEESAMSARDRYIKSVRKSKASGDVVLQQLRSAGVDVAAWKPAVAE